MQEMTIQPHTMRALLDQLRAVDVAVEGDGGRDMRRAELRLEIEDLNRDQQHELIALLWIGRGDFQEADWDEARALAEERHVGPTFDYLMSHLLAADEIAAGLEEIGHEHVLVDGTY